MKHNLQLNHQISKLIIPIEDNYLFSIPVINIIIPELNYSIHMQREEIIEGGHRKYGVYESIETSRILKELPERITIDIRDINISFLLELLWISLIVLSNIILTSVDDATVGK